MNEELKELFLHIVVQGKKDNTYKFALAKYLLDISFKSKEESDIEVSYYKIAEAFLKYYWFQECKYKLKQDFKQNSQPKVISIIQKYCGEEYIPQSYETYFESRQDQKVAMIGDIEKECLRDVIPRFQPEGSMQIYEHFHKKSAKRYKMPNSNLRYIVLSRESIRFFKSDYALLHKVVILEWAKFLEKTNFTPKLIAKIENLGSTKRSSLAKFKEILLEIDQVCFYCGKQVVDSEIHIDHFIPWSYIYEDEMWNLVLSCSSCNLKKKDYLANEKCLIKIIERNKKYSSRFQNVDVKEYYENCKKAGFLELKTALCQ